MTTIITDGEWIAADGRVTEDGAVFDERGTKLLAVKTGFGQAIFGSAGSSDAGAELFLQLKINTKLWLDAHNEPEFIRLLYQTIKLDRYPPHKSCNVLMVTSNQRVYYTDNGMIYQEAKDRPVFVGSGGGYAKAAMLAGADIREAMRTAAKLDVYSNNKITLMRVT